MGATSIWKQCLPTNMAKMNDACTLDANVVNITFRANAYYGGPKMTMKKIHLYIVFGVFITFKMILLIKNYFFTIIMCCTFFIIYFKTLSTRILESNSNILFWKILYSNMWFWPSKKVFKCPLSFIMASLIRILICILIIQLVIKYYYANDLITQNLWIHLGTK